MKEIVSIMNIYDNVGFLKTIGGTLIRGGTLNMQITW